MSDVETLGWFRMSSWLQIHRGSDIRATLLDGREAKYLGWRRAHVQIRDWWWEGPALSLLVDDNVTHGWDPATVVRLWRNDEKTS